VDAWGDIRLKARDCHQRALAESEGNRKRDAIVAAALKLEDLQLQHYQPGTIVGHGVRGFLDRGSLMVYVASSQSAEDEAIVIAHEIGHFKLHRDPRNEVTAIAPDLGGDSIDPGAGRVEGYSSRERKEVLADVFAGEFLCPSDWLREQLMAGKRPGEVAKDLELPPGLVMNQAIRALLLPPLHTPSAPQPMQAFELDESQLEAALWNHGPLLVDAGPGTGKTRTLVYRIQRLLEQGASPASILALTFSNKAAEEMRERLSAANADAAIEMWVGTFHQFGLELITKYHDRAGRSDKVQTLDEAGQLAILEDNLTRLPLRYFQNLYEPAYELVHVLRAISRCKDELITPAVYRAEAEAALAAAISDEQSEAAEKALEVAAIYEIYEDELRRADAVDFGDLIALTVRILGDNDRIRAEYQSRFEHVLVDEYQDVNLASARLLRALRGPGGDVWVVADQRQSIYRFRGAEPSNVQRFESELSGNRRSLKVNYRSGAAVVRAFQAFAANMHASPGGSWTPKRGNVGGLAQIVAPSVAGEAAAIRDHIEDARAKGIPYSDQAILARSHLTLARITGALEALGVPLLYLGDLFERPEIRDLLSLLSIDAEWGGIGLVRVAQLSEYGATKDDALAVIGCAKEKRVSIIEALNRAAEIEGLSDQGRKGLAALGAQLEGVGPATTPWAMLTTWLFERSLYLSSIISGNDAQQKLTAIYQFLKVCGEIGESGFASRKRFLTRIRRIEALNDERMYRAVASEASNIDGVRVLTIHGSKGLEFEAVHLPALATRYMPANRQAIRCPPPPTLAHLAIRPADHEAEEECLFFVALSRARDFLYLSRAEQYTRQNASASRFLTSLGSLAPARRRGDGPALPQRLRVIDPPATRQRYQERELSLYIQCPARYRYQILNGLRGPTDDSPYVRFHRCVHRTIGWIEAERSAGRPCDLTRARAQLAAEWAERGPVGHGFEDYYRASAETMVAAMVDVIAAETGTYDRAEWEVHLNGKTIVVTPDRVVIAPDRTVHVQRIRTGRKTKSEPDHRIYALLRRGAEARYRGRKVVIETFYLATREAVPVLPRKDEQLLGEYRDAITDIERGEFTPAPEDSRRCPNCQCYFICDYVQGIS
jgi:DNA helicase II / ATP-dependent DNA helicase PcrA